MIAFHGVTTVTSHVLQKQDEFIHFKLQAKVTFQKFIMKFNLEKKEEKKLNTGFSDNTTLVRQ